MSSINGGLLVGIVIAAVAFILLGVAMQFGPTMLEGYEAMRTASNVSEYAALEETIEFGPTIILLGFQIAVGVAGFMGIGIAGYSAYRSVKRRK